MKLRRVAPVLAIVAGLSVTAAGVGTAYASLYKAPKVGTWKLRDLEKGTAGGSAKVTRGAKQLTNVRIVLSKDNPEACGQGTLKVTKPLPIKRLATAKRPAVGKYNTKTKLIEPTATRISINGGASQAATALVLFDEKGKLAYPAKIEYGDCLLAFALYG